MKEGRDVWWHDVIAGQPDRRSPAESLPAEHPLFILYTSGTTGKPKGIVHTTGGYLLGAHLTTKYVFDLRDDDLYWCTADIGWVTGHSYVVYGPLSNGATTVMYEGAPDFPDKDRFWSIIERRKVTRVLHGAHRHPRLRALGQRAPAAGTICPRCACWAPSASPSTPRPGCGTTSRSAGGRCPIVDTWWQTETGAIMISPLPGITATKPGSCTIPFFGVLPEVVKKDGTRCAAQRGRLPGDQEALALDAARDPRRSRALREAVLVGDPGRRTSPATARARTRTATSG